MNQVVTTTFVVSLLLLHHGRGRCYAQENEQQKLLGQILKGTERFDGFYKNTGIRIVVHTRVAAATDEYKSREQIVEYEYIAQEPHYRLTVTDRSNQGATDQLIIIVNKDGCFKLKDSSVAGEHKLQLVYKDCREVTALILDYARIPRGGFWALNGPISRYLGEGDWSILQDESMSVASRKFVIDGEPRERELVLDRTKQMAAVKYRELGPGYENLETVEFDGEWNGVPLIKRITVRAKDRSGERTDVWEVKEWIHGPFPEQELSLSKYGIPTPVAQVSRLPIWFYLLLGLVVVVTAIAVLGKLASRRFTTPPNSSTNVG